MVVVCAILCVRATKCNVMRVYKLRESDRLMLWWESALNIECTWSALSCVMGSFIPAHVVKNLCEKCTQFRLPGVRRKVKCGGSCKAKYAQRSLCTIPIDLLDQQHL